MPCELRFKTVGKSLVTIFGLVDLKHARFFVLFFL